jgi:hypothetical protein
VIENDEIIRFGQFNNMEISDNRIDLIGNSFKIDGKMNFEEFLSLGRFKILISPSSLYLL